MPAMSIERRGRGGFRQAAADGPAWPRVSERRRRQLLLEAGWRRAAGKAVARRASVVTVDRGVLVLEIADPRWAAAVVALLPVAAARLARLCPDLGVRRFRIRAGPGAPDEPPQPLADRDEPPVDPSTAPTPREGSASRPIGEIAEAYLRRFPSGRAR